MSRCRVAQHAAQVIQQVIGGFSLFFDIGNQARGPVPLVSRNHADIANRRMAANHGFHAIEFDSDAADFDLTIFASDPIEQSIAAALQKIAAPQNALTRISRIDRDFICSASPLSPDSERDVWAPYYEFAHLVIRY